jgi:hypothetical protein
VPIGTARPSRTNPPGPTTPAAPASLPPLALAARELMEVLWHAPGPGSTRALHDAIARRYPRAPSGRSRPPRAADRADGAGVEGGQGALRDSLGLRAGGPKERRHPPARGSGGRPRHVGQGARHPQHSVEGGGGEPGPAVSRPRRRGAIQCRPEVEGAWWRVPPAGPGPLAALPEAVGAGP